MHSLNKQILKAIILLEDNPQFELFTDWLNKSKTKAFNDLLFAKDTSIYKMQGTVITIEEIINTIKNARKLHKEIETAENRIPYT